MHRLQHICQLLNWNDVILTLVNLNQRTNIQDMSCVHGMNLLHEVCYSNRFYVDCDLTESTENLLRLPAPKSSVLLRTTLKSDWDLYSKTENWISCFRIQLQCCVGSWMTSSSQFHTQQKLVAGLSYRNNSVPLQVYGPYGFVLYGTWFNRKGCEELLKISGADPHVTISVVTWLEV